MDLILYQTFKIISNTFKNKHGENTNKPSVQIYVNKIENRIIFKIKDGYILELLTSEAMKLLGSTKSKINEDINGENVPHLEITKVVLVHCKIVNNDYQQDSRVLYTSVPNKLFGSLVEICPTNHIFLKTFNSEFQTIQVWFTDQSSQSLEIEDRINLTLIIKQNINYKMTYSIEHRDRIYVKGYGFLSFAKSIGKNLSNKYGRKRFDRAIQKTIQKTVETTGDLIQ